MNSRSENSRPPGILGGGQLARMLCEAAHKIGISVGVLADNQDDPAAKVCHDPLVFGSLKDPECLRKFFSLVGPTAIESEFVDCDAIASANGLSLVHPNLDCIRIVQNKLDQKLLLDRLGISNSKLIRKPHYCSYDDWLPEIVRSHADSGLVLKWAEMGYDGKGTLIQSRSEDFSGFLARANQFCLTAEARGIEVYGESKINFVREVAMIGVRTKQGAFASYPLVVSEQTQGICKKVTGPAASLGTKIQLEKSAAEIVEKIGASVNLIGTYAVEFFEDSNGTLLVNEIAPRVHNTGHYTLSASETSQFENHWRALLDLPLGSTASKPYFAMLNLIGPDSVTRMDSELARPDKVDGVDLYWYFKKEIRPGRKLGHLNAWANTEAELKKKIELMEEIDRNWKVRCRN